MVTIKTYAPFEKELKRLAKKYRSIPADYARLLHDLTENPLLGVDLGKGIRKVRMAVGAKGKGKSHGARVITYTDAIVSVSEGELGLLYIYDKADRSTITDKEIIQLLRYIE